VRPSRSRDLILRIVSERPGIHVSRLCRDAGLAWGTVQYHLRRLESQGLVRERRLGRTVCIYAQSVPLGQEDWLSVLHSDIPRRILDTLVRHPWSSIREMSDLTHVSRKTVRRHLAGLLDKGFVTRDDGVRARFAASAPAWQAPPVRPGLAFGPDF
jgi:predicted transcriptional regulator